MTEQSGSTTSFSGGPQRGSTTIDSISHESIFCPTRAGDIFLFCRRQSRCCCTHSVGTHTTPCFLEWAPWLHWWHKMPSLGQKTLSSNALIQRIHYELKSCSPSSGSTDHALQFAPFSKASSKVVPQMNHVLKWTSNEPVLTDSSLQLRDQQSTFCHPAAQRGVLGSGEQRLHWFPHFPSWVSIGKIQLKSTI